MPNADMQQFTDLYFSEAEELLQHLNDDLLAYEKNPQQRDLLDSLMRNAHTIKGASNTMGFAQIGELTHALEDIFDTARKGTNDLSEEVINKVLSTFDALRDAINQIKTKGDEPDLSAAINDLRGSKSAISIPTPVDEPSSSSEPEPQIPPAKNEAPKPEIPTEVTETAAIAYIKVPVERLDNLLNLTEELIVNRMQLSEIISSSLQKYTDHNDSELRGKSPLTTKLLPLSDKISHLVSELRYHVMKARMVPLEQVFARFPRMVRDLAHKQNKEIEFIITGGDLELDRTIIDRLADPLVHLLRNAVDHGISNKGTIKLSATRNKQMTIVSVEDNGDGISWEKVKAKAISKNLLTVKDPDLQELTRLLFHPQMSTSEVITEVSGRGVGLDAVQEFVNEIGGQVTVESPLAGGGTKFSLHLPVSLAIVSSLLVKVSHHTYAIPFNSIERTVSVEKKNIKTIGDQQVAIVDGQDVPLFNIAEHFSRQDASEIVAPENSIVVIVKNGDDSVGLVVDSLINEQEIIVKALPPILKNNRNFSGSTILGNGRTALIVDAATIIQSNHKQK